MYKEIAANIRKTYFLISIFLIFIIGIGYGLAWYYGSPIILYIAIIFSIFQVWLGYYQSDKIALATSHAKLITGQENRTTKLLKNMVENLAMTDGLPTPKIYIMPDMAINAFATGRDPKHASVAVTQGALEKLENEELEGVLAHELSHVKNYDIRVMSLVVVLVGVIALISNFFLRSIFWTSNRRSSRDDNGSGIFMLVALVLSILAPITATLIQLAISRKRELLADASGVLLTRYPNGLINALKKIELDQVPMQHANAGTAHLFISNPFKKSGNLFGNLLSTHPPLDERIKKLENM
jgi:heat shock protein HtpX